MSTVVQTDPIETPETPSTDSTDPGRPSRPKFLALSSSIEKPDIQFSLEADSECRERFMTSMINANVDVNGDHASHNRDVITGTMHDSNLPTEPASMPPVISSLSVNNGAAFSYKNPAYQSANPTCSGSEQVKSKTASYSSDQDIPGTYYIPSLILSPRLYKKKTNKIFLKTFKS